MSAVWENAASVYDFTANNIQGELVPFEIYKGLVLLIVNVASKCGYTSDHYSELVALDEKYHNKGLRILAFPCNQFGHQEPGSNSEICKFAAKKNVKFEMFEKINVNGEKAHPLWKYLKKKIPGSTKSIHWNFTKFIVDKNGQPVERQPANFSPLGLEETLKQYL